MRKEFLYWYPLDLRCSAKDLIKNHLTLALFNHSVILSLLINKKKIIY